MSFLPEIFELPLTYKPSGGSGAKPEPTVKVWMGEGILGRHAICNALGECCYLYTFCTINRMRFRCITLFFHRLLLKF